MKIRRPSIRELQVCLTSLKAEIQDDYSASDDPDDLEPGMQVTLACDERGYALQTGDNSYSGPAYSYTFWGVGSLYRNTNCTELAKDLIDQCLELAGG